MKSYSYLCSYVLTDAQTVADNHISFSNRKGRGQRAQDFCTESKRRILWMKFNVPFCDFFLTSDLAICSCATFLLIFGFFSYLKPSVLPPLLWKGLQKWIFAACLCALFLDLCLFVNIFWKILVVQNFRSAPVVAIDQKEVWPRTQARWAFFRLELQGTTCLFENIVFMWIKHWILCYCNCKLHCIRVVYDIHSSINIQWKCIGWLLEIIARCRPTRR